MPSPRNHGTAILPWVEMVDTVGSTRRVPTRDQERREAEGWRVTGPGGAGEPDKGAAAASDGKTPQGEAEEAPDLRRLKRAELDAMALTRGVKDPDKLPNKDEVIAAIEAAGGDAAGAE